MHAADYEPDEQGVSWTHTHYGRGHAPTGDEAVRSVVAAWLAVGGPARLVTDEDAGWVAADAPPQTDGPWDAADRHAHTPAEAVRVWWDAWAGVEEEDDPGDWAAAVAAWTAGAA